MKSISSPQVALRIGVLVPQGNMVHEREFARLCPQGVSFSFRGFSYPPAAAADFCGDLISRMESTIKELLDWGAAGLLIGCTTASMQCAAEVYQKKLEHFANVPVITAASASRAAAVALGISAVAVATPYGDKGNKVVRHYLQSQRLTVTAIEGLGLDSTPQMWAARAPSLTPKEVLALALKVDSAQSQGLYLPCTGVGSLDAIELFEQRTGKPAFSSVQAGFWASLTRLGRDARQKGSGRLLETWGGAAATIPS